MKQFNEAEQNITLPAPESKAALHTRVAVVAYVNEYSAEAAEYARQTGKQLLLLQHPEDLLQPQALNTAKSITLIAGLDALSYSFFARLLNCFAIISTEGITIGILTGRTHNEVRQSIQKSLRLQQKQQLGNDLFLFGSPNVNLDQLFEGVRTFWWNDMKPEAVKHALQDEYDNAVLVSHSNGVDGNFAEIILCPVKDHASQKVYEGAGIPTCLHADLCQRDPQNKKTRIHPANIKADIVLYDTCAGFLSHGSFANVDASVGMAFLEGSAGAYISSVRKKTSSPYIAVIFRALLKDGYPLGQIVQVLNRFQESEFGECPSFILFGDPDYCETPVVSAHHSIDKEAQGFTVRDWGSYSLNFQYNNRNILMAAEQHPGVLTVEFCRPGGQQVLWMFRGHSRKETVSLRYFNKEQVRLNAKKLYERCQSNLSLLEILAKGLKDINVDASQFEQVIQSGKSLISPLNQVRQMSQKTAWTWQAFAELGQQIKDIVNAIDIFNQTLPVLWKQTRQWLVLHHYYGYAMDQQTPEYFSSQPCPSCGEKVTIKRFQNPSFAQLREMHTCISCGVIADITGELSVPVINSASLCKPGDSIIVKVEFNYDAVLNEKVHLLAYFGGFGADVVKCSLPQKPLLCTQDKHGRFSAEIPLEIAADCPRGLYSLVIVGAGLLSIFTAARYITVNSA